jgi:hypothetical protein
LTGRTRPADAAQIAEYALAIRSGWNAVLEATEAYLTAWGVEVERGPGLAWCCRAELRKMGRRDLQLEFQDLDQRLRLDAPQVLVFWDPSEIAVTLRDASDYVSRLNSELRPQFTRPLKGGRTT